MALEYCNIQDGVSVDIRATSCPRAVTWRGQCRHSGHACSDGALN